MAAISAPKNLHIQHSFNHSSLISSTSTFSSLKLHFFKPHYSLQTTFNTPQPISSSSSSSHSNNSSHLPCNSTGGDIDSELRTVLQLANSSELFEIEDILFGRSYFSPLLKSIYNGVEFDRFMVAEDVEEREHFIDVLESRFLYLAADARSTLRGWRPSYKDVLLDVRKELKISCSTKLSTEDLEAEIFIHLLGECSRNWGASLRIGTAELRSVILKGGSLISLLKISELVSTRFSSKMLFEAAKFKVDDKAVKKEFTRAASKYFGLRSLATFIGPMMWGTLLADIVIQMLGTDYIRILQAIYVFAQIRILRRHGLQLDKLSAEF